MQKSTALPIAILIFIIISACCICGGLLLVLGLNVMGDFQFNNILNNMNERIPGDEFPISPIPTIDTTPIDDTAYITLDMLQNSDMPISDPVAIANRLLGIKNVNDTVPAPSVPLKVGDHQLFWITNDDTLESSQVGATLGSIGEDIYFWIEDGVTYDQDDLEDLVREFNNKIVPTNRKFFGEEWIPGVDNDPRMYALYTRGLGEMLYGYFSAPDEFPPQVTQYANGHEMFVLSADNLLLDSDEIRSTMAHEYQHMIHWYRDRNEESWVNEGFSQLAEVLNNYAPPGHDYSFAMQPDTQLTDWSSDSSENSAHYGSSFLYMTYFLDRFGDKVTQSLVSEDRNGMSGVDYVLESNGITDPTTGKPIGADDVFADWVAAFYLNDPTVADGRYSFSLYPNPPSPNVEEEIRSCPMKPRSASVHQYGIDILEVTCKGEYIFDFQGSRSVQLIPTDAYSGKFSFWSNQGDQSNSTLTREFDLTAVSGEVEMTYQTWYRIEEDWDYLYVEASTNGEDWTILDTPSCTTYNPTGNSYGCGYTGSTNGWITERVDLSEYAGQKVLVRFDYITDTAVIEEGLLLDDVRVDAIDYFSDFEENDAGWVSEGFIRVENLLPQTFRVTLINMSGETTVETVVLTDEMHASIPFSIDSWDDEIVIIVSGTTRFTKLPAQYTYTIIQQ
ncbi:MAG: immune inhibitor A [Anaerolineaceae bacterium]|nr:immune inhibitor A [Anaerolineaceae bacterium]